jgi:PAS domain S-box-containing protein
VPILAVTLMPGDDHAAALFDVLSSSVRKLVGSVPLATVAVDVLEQLCTALGAHRGFIFENVTEQDRTVTANEVARWSAATLGPLVANLRRERAYDGWVDEYGPLTDEQGVVAGPVSRVGSPEREILRKNGAKSVLAVPILAGKRWWGYLGIHDCEREREWAPVQRRAAVAVASVLGAAVYHRPPTLDEGALQRLVERVPAILYVDDMDSSYHSIYVGPQVEAILGIPRATWLSDDDAWRRNMHPDDWPRVQAEHDAYLAHGGRLVQEYRMIRPDDGRLVWVHDDCTSYPGVEGESGVIQGVMSDVTEQKMLEEQLRAAEARNRTLIEQIPAVVYIEPSESTDEPRFVSASVETVFGVTREEWLATHWWSWHLHPEDRDRVLAFRREMQRHGEPARTEYRVVTDDHREVWIGEIARVVTHDGGSHVLQGLMEDITQRRLAEQQVQFLAYHDVLTGLSNRAMFEEHLELALARSRRAGTAVAVLYVDLDGLKRVNDTLGHEAGDQLLRTAASRLGAATRAVDLVARQGGDEFLVMLPDLPRTGEGEPPPSPVSPTPAPAAEGGWRWAGGPEAAEVERPARDRAVGTALAIADRICRAMREPTQFGGTQFEVSASVGISIFPDDADDIRTLLKHADEAMYQSKQHAQGEARVYGDRT